MMSESVLAARFLAPATGLTDARGKIILLTF